jgi:hypothetical protein
VRDFAKEAGVKAFGSVLLAKQAGWVPHTEPAPVPEVVAPPPPIKQFKHLHLGKP